MTTNFTNVNANLNMDVIQHILSYNDDLRILKIKMNKQNMKYLFENKLNIRMENDRALILASKNGNLEIVT